MRLPGHNSQYGARDLVLPWPDTFPDFKGLAIKTVSDDLTARNGASIDVRKQEYTNFRWHPDAQTFPNIACAYFKDVRYECDRFFRVDRKRKAMQLIGFSVSPVEGRALEQHGKWQWYPTIDGDNMQYSLNADNTVLREVNYGDKSVIKTGDWSKNVKFNLALPPEDDHLVAPDIAPQEMALQIDHELDEIKEYFTADAGMYRSLVDISNQKVHVSAEINQLMQIDMLNEHFGARLYITFTWKVTKDDVVSYVAHPASHDRWEPEYMPPHFEVENPASGHGASTMYQKYSRVDLIKTDEGYVAIQTLTVSGDFWEPFELQNYPFDVQPLNVNLVSIEPQPNDVDFTWACGELPHIRDTEWEGIGSSARISFNADRGHRDDQGRYWLNVDVVAQRHYSVHMYRVVAVMAVFSLASVSAMIADPEVNSLERLAIAFSMMLTATAYSLVVSAELPTLGYLTFMDAYILGTFAFISLVAAEITVIEWAVSRHSSINGTLYDVDDAIEFASYADLVLWVSVHLALFLYIKCTVIPAERMKIDRELGHDQAKGSKAKKKVGKEKKKTGGGRAGGTHPAFLY